MKDIDLYYKWVEWSKEDQVYIGKCPDLITSIHGDNPLKLYKELHEVVEDVIKYLITEERELPKARTRPMQEVA